MKIDLDEILDEICAYYDLTHADLSGLDRYAKMAKARHLYFILARELTPASLREIGEKIKRHHASVMHGIKKFSHYMTYEEERDYDTVKEKLLSGNPSEVLQCYANLGMAYSLIDTITYSGMAATIRSGRPFALAAN